jgi:hypothetical protein
MSWAFRCAPQQPAVRYPFFVAKSVKTYSVEPSVQVIAATGERSAAISGTVETFREVADQAKLGGQAPRDARDPVFAANLPA